MKKHWQSFEVQTDMKHITYVNYHGKLGDSRCHPDDTFDLGTGIKVAYERALQAAEAEEKQPFVPAMEEKYYVPAPTIRCKYTMRLWINSTRDQFLLEKGLVFRSRQDAILTANRMLATLK